MHEALIVFLTTNFGLQHDELGASDPLFSSGLLDSFSMVQLVMFVEGEAGVRLNPEDITLDNFDTIGSILAFLAEVAGQQGE